MNAIEAQSPHGQTEYPFGIFFVVLKNWDQIIEPLAIFILKVNETLTLRHIHHFLHLLYITSLLTELWDSSYSIFRYLVYNCVIRIITGTMTTLHVLSRYIAVCQQTLGGRRFEMAPTQYIHGYNHFHLQVAAVGRRCTPPYRLVRIWDSRRARDVSSYCQTPSGTTCKPWLPRLYTSLA